MLSFNLKKPIDFTYISMFLYHFENRKISNENIVLNEKNSF